MATQCAVLIPNVVLLVTFFVIAKNVLMLCFMMSNLSPTAQAMLTAQARERCLHEWSTTNDPPCHPDDPGWNGCKLCVDCLATTDELAITVESNDCNL